MNFQDKCEGGGHSPSYTAKVGVASIMSLEDFTI